jgi:CRP/FNR family transcriptional regulator, cyclic AMP receptor protein
MSHSALWYFEHFGLLQGLSDEQKQHVRQKSRMFEVKRGQPIYLLGDQSEHVYLVKTGAVKILGHAPEGCDVMLAVLTPGDIFGELALTDDASRDHRAEPTTTRFCARSLVTSWSRCCARRRISGST